MIYVLIVKENDVFPSVDDGAYLGRRNILPKTAII